MAFIFNYSPTRGSFTLISTHGESHMNTCQGRGNQLSLGHTIFGNVLKLYVLQTRKVSQYLLLTVNVSCQGLVSILTSIVSLQDPLQCLKSLFRVHSGRYFSYSKKGKIAKMSTCHSLPLAVPLVITRCTTSCITRLSFYKQSDFF